MSGGDGLGELQRVEQKIRAAGAWVSLGVDLVVAIREVLQGRCLVAQEGSVLGAGQIPARLFVVRITRARVLGDLFENRRGHPDGISVHHVYLFSHFIGAK